MISPRRRPGFPATGVLIPDVVGSPQAGSPPDDPASLAAWASTVDPSKDRAPVFSSAVATSVSHPRVDAQRQEVGDEQAERGQDQAHDVAEDETEDQDAGEDPRERGLGHETDDTDAGSQVLSPESEGRLTR